MTAPIVVTEGDYSFDILPTDFVKCVALEVGFPQSHGQLVKPGEEFNMKGSEFAHGKPTWLKIIGVYGAKIKEEIVPDESNVKAPVKTKKG